MSAAPLDTCKCVAAAEKYTSLCVSFLLWMSLSILLCFLSWLGVAFSAHGTCRVLDLLDLALRIVFINFYFLCRAAQEAQALARFTLLTSRCSCCLRLLVFSCSQIGSCGALYRNFCTRPAPARWCEGLSQGVSMYCCTVLRW